LVWKSLKACYLFNLFTSITWNSLRVFGTWAVWSPEQENRFSGYGAYIRMLLLPVAVVFRRSAMGTNDTCTTAVRGSGSVWDGSVSAGRLPPRTTSQLPRRTVSNTGVCSCVHCTSHTHPAVLSKPYRHCLTMLLLTVLINTRNVPSYILLVVNTAMGNVWILSVAFSNRVCEICLSSCNRKHSRVKRKGIHYAIFLRVSMIKNMAVCHKENVTEINSLSQWKVLFNKLHS
jgi:hypothetical protein